MLNKYRPYFISAALFYLSESVPALYPLKAIAFVPFLIRIKEDRPILEGVLASLAVMASWSLAILLSEESAMHFPILNSIALILYVISRKTLGAQRSYIALTFLWLSAEALPFTFPVLTAVSYPLSEVLFEFHFLKDWLSLTGFLGASFWILSLNMLAFAFTAKYGQPRQWKPLIWSFAILIVSGIIIPIQFSPASTLGSLSEYPEIGKTLMSADLFLTRMSYFLAFFLLLFSVVKHILRNSKRDDRFT